MSEDNKSIHEFDFKLICEYFASIERQGPGSPEVTLKALSFIDNLSSQSKIADIGCGSGGQTMILAGNTEGKITGVDLFPEFIDLFNAKSRELGFDERVTGVICSMETLEFGKEELDLIWSEGAIYNIGFERGIKEWREFLKPGGYIAVSEASWFTGERPGEIEEYWNASYPEIDTIPNKLAQMQKGDMFRLRPLYCRKNAGQSIFTRPKRRLKRSFSQSMPGIKQPKNSSRTSVMKLNCTQSIKSITDTPSLSVRRYN